MAGPGEDTLLEFPCRFPIKMMGRRGTGFRRTAVAIVEGHVGEIPNDDVREAESSKGNFVSVTVTITATSREQLDDIYRALTDHEAVLVAL